MHSNMSNMDDRAFRVTIPLNPTEIGSGYLCLEKFRVQGGGGGGGQKVIVGQNYDHHASQVIEDSLLYSALMCYCMDIPGEFGVMVTMHDADINE